MWLIAVKELKELLYSPKFIFIFVAATLLILTSVFNGYLQYSAERSYAESKTQEARERFVKGGISQHFARTNTYRKPTPLSIFDMGVSGIIGRSAWVSAQDDSGMVINNAGAPNIMDQKHSQHPVMALFGDLNLSFVVTVMLSLFAILLSYNAICGERESGTLGLVFSNTISRSSMYLGKFIGGLIPLLLLFIVPFIIALIGLMLFTDVQFSAAEWFKILMMVGAVMMFLSLFHIVGLASSTLTKSSFVSFMICLLIWIFALAITPRLSVQAARVVSPAMSSDEMNTRNWMLQRQLWRDDRNDYYNFIEKNVITRENFGQKMQEYYGEKREKQQEMVEKQTAQLWQEFRRRREALAQSAATFSRLSPISCLQFTVHSLTGTGHELLQLFEDSMTDYKRTFAEYANRLWTEYKDVLERPRPQKGPYEFRTDEGGFIRVVINEDILESQRTPELPITVNSIPEFSISHLAVAEAANQVLIDAVLIFIYAIIYFCVGYVVFLRYDLRS